MKLLVSRRIALNFISTSSFSKRGYTSSYKCLTSEQSVACSSTEAWDYDVLINGGGIVGASLAADLLSNTDGALRIGIIEPVPVKPLKQERSVPDVRVYAVSPKSISFLERIGAWKYIENRSHPYKSMQIWEQSGPGLVKFHAKDLEVNELGRICEDSTIQSAIYKVIEEMGHKVDIISTHSISDCAHPTDSFQVDPVRVTLTPNKGVDAGKKQVSARLLVGADGNMSVVRRLTGIPTWGWNYGQEGVVATISFRDTLPSGQDEQISPLANYNLTAYQKYLPTGPLAILPLWDGYASIVWSLPTLEAKRVKSLSNESFLKELNDALRSIPKTDKWSVLEPEDGTNFPPAIDNLINLVNKATGGYGSVAKRAKREVAAVLDAAMSAGQLTDPLVIPPAIKHVCGPRVGFPLAFQQAKYYTSPRVALIGDAAHSIHPQAGQGLNLGIADSATLSANILDALATGQDYGSTRVLSKFGNERYKHNLAMMGIVDVLNSFFKDRIDVPIMPEVLNSRNLPFVKGKQLARSLGMLGVHNLGPIKQEMAKYAMGLK